MTPKNILRERIDHHIEIIKINRPGSLNALNLETLGELKTVLNAISHDSEVRAVILTGAGDKAFVAGADISEMAAMSPSEAILFAQSGQDVTRVIEQLPQPVIGAVNGFALGGGTELALSCDFIYASSNAVFGQPEVALGVIPGFGGTVRLSKFVGLPRARELILTGRRIKAAEAFEMGLVNRVTESHELLPAVVELARMIASQSASAIRRSKRLLNEFAETVGIDYKLDSEAQEFGRCFSDLDQKEGMSAFLEKRKPKFEGLL